jgi:hypothetical protein
MVTKVTASNHKTASVICISYQVSVSLFQLQPILSLKERETFV